MKKYFPLALVAVLAALISCTENEEPVDPLMGTWEHREFVDSLNIWIVETKEFKNDSVFDLSITVRESETGPDLGYRMITTSWFNLEGDTFKYYFSDALTYFRNSEDAPLYVPKSELRAGIFDFFRIPEGVLTFSSDRRRFQFQENCLVINPDAACLEFPVKEYIRVN